MRQENPNILRRSLVAVGLLATAALHGHIESNTDHGHGPRVEVNQFNPFAEVTTDNFDMGTEPVSDPYVTTIEVEKEKEADAVALAPASQLEIRNIPAEYAPNFAQDPMAGEFDRESAEEVVGVIEQLQADGWTVEVSVQGFASAEDNSVDADAGLQTPSEANQELAELRRDVVVDKWIESGLDASLITKEPGVEDEFSDEQVMVLEGLRDQFGYETVGNMIKRYNAQPDTVPEAVGTTLDEWLKEKRGTVTIITATGPEVATEVEAESEVSTREVCVMPVLSVSKEEQTTQSYKATIPYGVMLPVAAGAASMLYSFGTGLHAVAGTIARSRRRRTESLTKSQTEAATSGGGSSGDGGEGGVAGTDGGAGNTVAQESAATNIVGLPEGGSKDESGQTLPSAAKPEDSQETTTEPKGRKKRKNKLGWDIFIIGATVSLTGIGLAHACSGEDESQNDSQAVVPPTVESVYDPCEGLEVQEKIVGSAVHTERDGRFRSSDLEFDPDFYDPNPTD